MRKGLWLALVLAPIGCAHQTRSTNLAERPSVVTPRGDFSHGNAGNNGRRDPSRPQPVPPAPIP